MDHLMDIVLVSVAGISLVLAVGMGLLLFRLFREEGQRSDARVALLAVAAAPPDPSLMLHEADADLWSPAPAPEVADRHAELFATPVVSSPWGRRLAVAGTLGAAIAVAAYALAPGHTPGPTGSAAAVSPQAVPLELLSLQHMQEPDGLTVSGLVQNPRTGKALREVSATAFLFGPDGDFLASGRAGLDYARLGPGDESPFVIKVPVTSTISRYRVGFRGPDGAVIAHVDRRADGSNARNDRGTGSVPWVR